MFEKLLTPLQVGNITLQNRVLMGSMHTGLEEDPEGSRKLAAFYEERAKGGVGLIVTGGFSPNTAGRVFEEGADLVSEDQLEFHRPITEAVHRHGGRILLQTCTPVVIRIRKAVLHHPRLPHRLIFIAQKNWITKRFCKPSMIMHGVPN